MHFVVADAYVLSYTCENFHSPFKRSSTGKLIEWLCLLLVKNFEACNLFLVIRVSPTMFSISKVKLLIFVCLYQTCNFFLPGLRKQENVS